MIKILFDVLNYLYTRKDLKWLDNIDNNVSPVIINKFLLMNPRLSQIVRYLDKFTFFLSQKHWLILAWSLIPKYNKMPFNKYIKPIDNNDLYDELWIKVRNILELSDNDFKYAKLFILKEIEKDKGLWFKKLGMSKEFCIKHNIDFNNIKTGGIIQGKKGLELFGV